MSLAQLRTYLMTDEAKKDLIEKARAAGYEVEEKDLECVTGGLVQGPDSPDSGINYWLSEAKDSKGPSPSRIE